MKYYSCFRYIRSFYKLEKRSIIFISEYTNYLYEKRIEHQLLQTLLIPFKSNKDESFVPSSRKFDREKNKADEYSQLCDEKRRKIVWNFSQVLSLYHVGVCYICFDNLLCLMNLHAATQFRILQHRLSDLGSGWNRFNKIDRETSWSSCVENCYATFKLCVKQHQDRITYCQRLNDIFTIIVLGHVLVFSLLMCLVGFQVLMVCINLIYFFSSISGKINRVFFSPFC